MDEVGKILQYTQKLADGLQEYRKEVSEAEKALSTAQRNLQAANQRLAAAEKFYRMDLERLRSKAEQLALPLEGTARFLGLAPRQACMELLKERGQMSIEELERELTEGGFVFTGSPMRIIHMALVTAPGVERLKDGVFKYHEEGS